MFFGSSKPDPPPTSSAASDMSIAPASDLGSESVKKAIMRQILVESNTANARLLIERVNESCFEKCIPKPGSSVSGGEQTCVTQCMDKYITAWNQVNAAYLKRIQQEVGNSSGF